MLWHGHANSQNLQTYVPLALTCRLLDTRITQGGAGPLTAAHGKYQFGTTASSIGSAAQNGNPAGCGIPSGAAAIAVNMNMLDATAAGNILAWSTDIVYQQPSAGIAVYNPSTPFDPTPGDILYNGGFAIVPLGTSYGDFFLAIANGQLDMTINVVGYWLPFSWETTQSGWRSIALGDETFSTGSNSFTTGYLTSAKGSISTAIGYGTTAGGDYSLATGRDTNASGGGSTAMGQDTTAQGAASTALGYSTTAVGDYSTALGWWSKASGKGSAAIGLSSNATAPTATAIGEGVIASGNASFATGYYTIAQGNYSTATGWQTKATEFASTAIGHYTTASGIDSTAIGLESTASGRTSIAGGDGDSATGDYAIAIGSSNVASGAFSTAMGVSANTNGHLKSFVYGDGSASTMNDADYQFVVRAYGGMKFFTSTDITSGVMLAPGSSAWTTLSDFRAKDAIEVVDARTVLAKVAVLPLSTWRYKTQNARYRHMGPMAQDFYAAFRLGESDTGIDTVDADGVALAAIQGLNLVVADELEKRDREITMLREEVISLKRAVIQKSSVATIERLRGELEQVRAQLDALLSVERAKSTPLP